MNRGVWTVLIIAILVALGVFAFLPKEASAPADGEGIPAGQAIKRLENATILVPDLDVSAKLENGEALFPVTPEGDAEGIVSLVPGVSAEWEGSGRRDLAAVLAVNSGGTGTFYYLALFDVKNNTLTQKSFVFLGDRIEVTNVGIGELVNDLEAEYRLTVQTLVRADDEPLAAAPTIPETRTFYVTKQILEEVETGADDS